MLHDAGNARILRNTFRARMTSMSSERGASIVQCLHFIQTRGERFAEKCAGGNRRRETKAQTMGQSLLRFLHLVAYHATNIVGRFLLRFVVGANQQLGNQPHEQALHTDHEEHHA